MDVKARSKPMREILTRLVDRMKGAVEIKIFGDKVILDEGESCLGLLFSRSNVELLCGRRGELAAM